MLRPACSCGAVGTAFEDMSYAELLWVDYLGVYVKTASQEGVVETLRVPFIRPVHDERDARSLLTMMAQVGALLGGPAEGCVVGAGGQHSM